MRRVALKLLAAALVAMCAASGHAQDWPNKPIRLISPFPPGGAVDVLARTLAEKLTQELGQPVVVANVAGADGKVGMRTAASAPPDGYTFVMTGSSTILINPAVAPKQQPFDTLKDFTHVAILATSPLVLLANPNLPAASVTELIPRLKAEPNKFSVGWAGASALLTGELFKHTAGVSLLQVPYKGNPEALVDVIAGRVDLMFAVTTVAIPAVKGGKVKALGITSLQRDPSLPTVPTVAESGVPGFDVVAWHALSGPAGLPPEIVSKLNTTLQRIVNMPDVKARLQTLGTEPARTGNAAEVSRYLAAEKVKWDNLVKQAGVQEK